MRDNTFLSDADREHFLKRGHVVVKNCFTREAASELTDRMWVRLGFDPTDENTWTSRYIHMPAQQHLDVATFAPKAYGAICELLGGEERVRTPIKWGDGFIVNLSSDENKRTWQEPSANVTGWHKDGDWFLHFLDSPEQGLLVVVLWSDIQSKGGGTFLACDSVPVVARYLLEHPEGVQPDGFGFQKMVTECHDFVELTGEVGDVVLLHPYMLHTASKNTLPTPRVITNPAISLLEPMRFDRPNPDDFSPVEQAILNGIGVSHLDFAPTAPRERIVPEREIRQRKMREEEQARLAAIAG